MKEKVLGILGGMGPEATADLFMRIIRATNAKSDEEHLRIIIDNNPKMPSRQDAILKGAESPVPAMTATAENLVGAGADFLIIGANTAHYFYDDVQKAINVPILHIIDETLKEVSKNIPHLKKLGILATTAAMQTRLYSKCCDRFGIAAIEPDDALQSQMHNAIFSFKHQGLSDTCIGDASEVAESLIAKGAEALVMGCTEIPLILAGKTFSVPLVDPNEIIAHAVVAYAKGL